MPATYAHYRFGAQMLQRMPADIRRAAKRHRRLFDVGLHGPDLFFYYRPMCSTKVGALGCKFHLQTGREFFTRACRNLRLEPSEAAQAYLYGVLCHFSLDSHCHPFVMEKSREGLAGHTQIETEFDRFLMEKDGIEPPYRVSFTKHMALTEPECEVASRFYPGTEGKHIRESLRGMVNIRKALELPDGPVRTAVVKTMSTYSETFREMVMGDAPDPVCQQFNLPLMERYDLAARRFPDLLLQLGAHLTYNAPLKEDFDPVFG